MMDGCALHQVSYSSGSHLSTAQISAEPMIFLLLVKTQSSWILRSLCMGRSGRSAIRQNEILNPFFFVFIALYSRLVLLISDF
jgi:hypothetical protein